MSLPCQRLDTALSERGLRKDGAVSLGDPTLLHL